MLFNVDIDDDFVSCTVTMLFRFSIKLCQQKKQQRKKTEKSSDCYQTFILRFFFMNSMRKKTMFE